jgi:hypothetical protein
LKELPSPSGATTTNPRLSADSKKAFAKLVADGQGAGRSLYSTCIRRGVKGDGLRGGFEFIDSGFRILGSVFKVRVWGLGFQGLGFRDKGLRFRV